MYPVFLKTSPVLKKLQLRVLTKTGIYIQKEHKKVIYFLQKGLVIFLVFIEEIAFKHFLFINIAKFRFFLFFNDHTHH